MVKRIIIRNANWLGDAVMALPTIEAVRQGYPEAQISLLTKASLATLFEGNPFLTEVISLPSSNFSQLFPFSPFIRGLKKKAFDLAIVLPNSFQSALVFFVAGIRERIGYHTDYRKILLTKEAILKPATITKHQVYYYCDLLRLLNLELTSVRPEIHLSDQVISKGAELLDSLGIRTQSSGLLIGFNPGAAYGPAKRWPTEKYAQLAKQLKKSFKAQTLLFGSQEDGELSAKIQTLAQGTAINLAGKFNLSDYMRIMRQCDLIVTNDSGGMHLAAALGVPLVAVFGSTNPFRTGPLSSRQRIIYKKTDCAPCLKRVCPTDFICMNNISVEEVFQAASDLLAEIT